MLKTEIKLPVAEAAILAIKNLQAKDFIIFCDIDHQANAKKAGLEMPASRVIIFGNPVAGTKLMMTDMAVSLDLPLRLALVEQEGKTFVIHHTTEDFCRDYSLDNHPVLEKIAHMFTNLVAELAR
jgi:uncharacterized protein (DUF302 family)